MDMMYRYIFLLSVLLLIAADSFGQEKKKGKRKADQENTGQPTTLSPYAPQKSQEPVKSKTAGPKLKVRYDIEKEYFRKVKQTAKENQRIEKELKKPQYSDPLYFGHKRPPKKRPLGKTKYCKECGLKH
jgi:hypothetical protein